LDTLKLVEQSWHIVCGNIEIEELSRQGKIKQWHPRNDRHSLFMTMKYPSHSFYKGGWGPELLHMVTEQPHLGTVGKVFCTYNRYTLITRWLITNTFPA